MKSELISVIVSAYNAENTIMKCINSILAQSYTLFEVIIVDDGSNDKTAAIIDEMASQDDRILVVHKENGGLTSAREKGFTLSNGEFICFLDSDDYIEKNYLKELHSFMNEGTDIVIGSYYVENQDYRTTKQFDSIHIDKKDFTEKFILPSIYYIKGIDEIQYPDFVWLRLYRKAIITKKCFVSERICYTEDLFFQLYALQNATGVTISDKPVYHYVVTEQSLTQKFRANKLQMVLNRLEMVKEYCLKNHIAVLDSRYVGLEYISMLGCVYNARIINDLSKFKFECQAIRNALSDCFRISYKSAIDFKNTKQFLIYIMMRMKLYTILYILMGI